MIDDKKIITLYADTVIKQIREMCVTTEINEVDTMYVYAKKNLEKLHTMIFERMFRR